MEAASHIILSGELGEKFGRDWHLGVSSPAEALRAIEANKPGLIRYIRESAEHGVGYTVLVGDRPIEENELRYPTGSQTIRFVPVLAGASDAFKSIVIGALIIVASIYFAPVTAGVAAGAQYGTVATGSAFLSSTLAAVGYSMVLGGVAQLLTPTPGSDGASQPAENTPNNYFDGPVNTVAAGGPVPLAYGEVIAGSQVLSAGMYAG